jgi:hypothetical protein
MADPAPTDAAGDALVEDAVSAAAGYRKVGDLLVAFLTAAPAATVLTGLVALPDGSEWDEELLAVGLGLAGIAVCVGLAVAAWLRSPVALTDTSSEVTKFTMARVLGGTGTYSDLTTNIVDLLGLNTRTTDQETELKNSMAQRLAVYRLATADALADRVKSFWVIAGMLVAIAAGLSAIGVLAVAPKPTSAGGTDIVAVTLTPEGQAVFDCDADSFIAIRVGGGEDDPEVVPLGVECTAGAALALSLEKGNGSASKVEKVEPFEAEITTTEPSTATEPATSTSGR